MKPACDCLNDCGDDNRIASGEVEPCDAFKRVEVERQTRLRTQKEMVRKAGLLDQLAKASYHDIVVYCDGQRYELGTDSYSLMLTCTRAGGWELWDCRECLIGGQFHSAQFSLEIAGVLVCGKKPEGI